MSRYLKSLILMLVLLLVFLGHGCYTAFTHPPLNQARSGQIYITDDCLECHDKSQYSTTVLPESAQNDVNWQFYSGSAWWQDEHTIVADDAVIPSSETGPRNRSYTPQTIAPVAMPVQGGTSLGKTSADTENSDRQQATESKRSAGRRSHTASTSESSDSSSQRSGRR